MKKEEIKHKKMATEMTSKEIQKNSKSVCTVWVTEMEKALNDNLNNPYAVVNEINNNDYSANQNAWLVQKYSELNDCDYCKLSENDLELSISKEEIREKAKKFLEKKGYGKGTNFTVNTVISLMSSFTQSLTPQTVDVEDSENFPEFSEYELKILCDSIKEVLMSANLEGVQIDDGGHNGFPLIDYLSESSFKLNGKEEISHITDQIYDYLKMYHFNKQPKEQKEVSDEEKSDWWWFNKGVEWNEKLSKLKSEDANKELDKLADEWADYLDNGTLSFTEWMRDKLKE